MNPNTPRLDPVRAEAMRRVLLDSVRQSAPVPSRRRTALFASMAVGAVVVVVGGGVVAYSLGHARSAGGGPEAVAPPATSSSRPSDSSTPSATSTAPGIVDPAGSPSPTAIPRGIDLANPNSWTITTAGIGPLTLGGSQTKQSAEAAQGYTVKPQAYSCPVIFYDGKAGVSTAQLTTQAAAKDEIDLIMIGQLGMAPPTDSPKTPSGIGLGATEAALLATYPGIEEISVSSEGASSFGKTYGIQDAQGRWLSFELDETARVGEIVISYTEGGPGEFC